MKGFFFSKIRLSLSLLFVALLMLVFFVVKSFLFLPAINRGTTDTLSEDSLGFCGNVMTVEESEGSDLFRKNCERCHYPSDKKLTGPGLNDVSEKIPKKPDNWLRLYLTNADSSIFKDDVYVKSLRQKYNHTSIHSHVRFTFSEKDWEYLLLYLNRL